MRYQEKWDFMESRKLSQFKSPSIKWHLRHNTRWNCVISKSIPVDVSFQISLNDLGALSKVLLMEIKKNNELSEILGPLQEILSESVKQMNHGKV